MKIKIEIEVEYNEINPKLSTGLALYVLQRNLSEAVDDGLLNIDGEEEIKNWDINLIEMPRWEHDCDSCKFLGYYKYSGKDYDLWFCPGGSEPTPIARWGLDGNYMSGLPFAKQGKQPYAEALSRATDRGLYKES